MSEHSEKVRKKIKIFEKAVDVKKLELHPIEINRIFLAVDSHTEAVDINEYALQIVLNLAKKHKAEVYIACIAPTNEELKISEILVNKSIKFLELENISVTGSCGYGHPSEHILELSNQFNPSLIILPTPYGERSEPFNIESLGTSVDIILRKSPFPTLLLREPIYSPNELMKSILLFINSIKSTKVAEWTLTLAENDSRIMLLSITEKETVEKVEELAHALLESKIDKSIVEHAHTKENLEFINAIISEAKSRDLQIEREHRIGDRIRLILEEIKKDYTILIIGTIIEQDNILENEIENICRFAKIPVLVIKN